MTAGLRLRVLLGILVLCLLALPFRIRIQNATVAVVHRLHGTRTVAERVAEYGPAVRERLGPDFERVGIPYPPSSVMLAAFKRERRLEVWVAGDSTEFRLLRAYPVLAASGVLGPKLREGDRQVPEGIYRIESLNPNSLFHLSLRVNYPNEFDRAKARLDERDDLGGDIMIHGGRGSIGCLAMGDPVAEDLFVLAADAGIKNVSVLLSPMDLRVTDPPEEVTTSLPWAPELYDMVRRELEPLAPVP